MALQAAAAADMKRALLPVNTLVSWLLVGLSTVLGLKIIGLDPVPLLALGGVSGIVVGFASQQLLLNLMAGISIFLTRPFIVGDIVQVRNNHLLIASGTIAHISPLRTTFLDENSQAIALPNKLLSDLIITNYGDTTRMEQVCFWVGSVCCAAWLPACSRLSACSLGKGWSPFF
jgi:small-conductance mechanosensitive channel